LKDHRFLAGAYSIADMACVGSDQVCSSWQQEKEGSTGVSRTFPHPQTLARNDARTPAVQRGMHIRVEEASRVDVSDPKVRAVLFGQRAK